MSLDEIRSHIAIRIANGHPVPLWVCKRKQWYWATFLRFDEEDEEDYAMIKVLVPFETTAVYYIWNDQRLRFEDGPSSWLGFPIFLEPPARSLIRP